jgi:hypothetical protein
LLFSGSGVTRKRTGIGSYHCLVLFLRYRVSANIKTSQRYLMPVWLIAAAAGAKVSA